MEAGKIDLYEQAKTLRQKLQLYLISSYCYYIRYYSILTDSQFDQKCETGREDFEVPDAGGSVTMTYIYEDVIFNGKLFHVEWVSSSGGLEYRLLGYRVEGTE